ncbi:MAG TPA: YwmB family TATA-box binding protein [Bacillota bacterium]|nr:YwmB family TATA-box binding protein [Bacillota bacterium]
MLKKYLLNMGLSALFLVIFSIRFVDVTIGEKLFEFPLETAWKVTGLPLTEINVEAWMKLNDQWLSAGELKGMAPEIAKQLELNKETSLTAGAQSGYSFASFEGTQRDGTVITITLQSSNDETEHETQLGIITAHDGHINNLRHYIESLKAAISLLNPKREIHFSVEFQGQRSGKITPLFIKDLSGRAFQKIDAELVESGYVNGASSQKGYTRLIHEAIVYNFKRINIEICTRYDETRNLTEIIMATPNSTDGV